MAAIHSVLDELRVAVTPELPELRLLMGPVSTVKQRFGGYGEFFRFVTETNGHPGGCGEDCWHESAERALICWRGEVA